MGLIEWAPVKNTERQAIKTHGSIWTEFRLPWTPTMASQTADESLKKQRRLIESPDKVDLRWIDSSQVVSEVIDTGEDEIVAGNTTEGVTLNVM